MITKRDLAVAWFSFCLTVILFMIVPTESRVGYYDPWIDLNDDGKIDMKDLAEVAKAYGSLGDPINKTELLLNLQDRVEALETPGLPAPDYTSDWISIDPGETKTLTHNLGTTNVLVHIQGWHPESGVHQHNYGSNLYQLTRLWYNGAWWCDLNTETIKVVRNHDDADWEQIRVLLWLIQP